jgi:amino acid transporter
MLHWRRSLTGLSPGRSNYIILCAALSCFGNVVLDLLCTPGLLFAGARDGIFPKYLGKVHSRFATPLPGYNYIWSVDIQFFQYRVDFGNLP